MAKIGKLVSALPNKSLHIHGSNCSNVAKHWLSQLLYGYFEATENAPRDPATCWTKCWHTNKPTPTGGNYQTNIIIQYCSQTLQNEVFVHVVLGPFAVLLFVYTDKNISKCQNDKLFFSVTGFVIALAGAALLSRWQQSENH